MVDEEKAGDIVVGEVPWHETKLLPAEILDNSPSRQDRISPEMEAMHRVFGCELIQEAGILMKMPQGVMVTGQHILHRFFYRKPLTKFDAFTIAMGCLLLAAKLEEHAPKMRDVVFMFHDMYQRRKGLKRKALDIGSQRYRDWKEELQMSERYILQQLGFSFYNIMDHPHKFMLYYLKVLSDDDKAFGQKAWAYLNDSMRLDVCLRFPSQAIACAAIYLSSRALQRALPENPPWWEVFSSDQGMILEISDAILGLYHMPKFQWLEPLVDVDYLNPAKSNGYDQPAAPADDICEPQLGRETVAMVGGEQRNVSPVTTAALSTPIQTQRPRDDDNQSQETMEAVDVPRNGHQNAERNGIRSRSSSRRSMRSREHRRNRRSRTHSRSRTRSDSRSNSRSRSRRRDRDRDRDRDRSRRRDSRGRNSSRSRDRERRRDRSRDRHSRRDRSR